MTEPAVPMADRAAKLLWSFEDVALLLDLSPKEVRRMVQRGELPLPRRQGRRSLFLPDEIKAAIAKLPQESAR